MSNGQRKIFQHPLNSKEFSEGADERCPKQNHQQQLRRAMAEMFKGWHGMM
jgi:hypothetical protein